MPQVVSSRVCLWKVRPHLRKDKLPCQEESGLQCGGMRLSQASSALAALLSMARA